MNKIKGYENFPGWIVFLSNLIAISIYGVGAYIIAGFGILFSIMYLLYCLFMEINVLRRSCINCYYYGKVCGFGKGKLCAMLFKQGDLEKFAEQEISWIKMVPDFMVFVFPIICGIILMIKSFSLLILILMVILAILSFGGNAIVRGSFACKYCKQMEIGCPAEKLFNKEAG